MLLRARRGVSALLSGGRRIQLRLLTGETLVKTSERRRSVKHFLNLSNGVEAALPLIQAGLPVEQINFVRLQSTHCENRDHCGVLESLDNNLLINLALGFDCRIYDFGSRAQPFVPRALWWGMEWSRYTLCRAWKLEPPVPYLRGHKVQDYFEQEYRQIQSNQKLYRRLKYYRTFVTDDCVVLLRGVYARTLIDGKKELHRDMLLAYAETLKDAQEAGPPCPPPDAVGMSYYVSKPRAAK